jgi:hypothetical protein
VGCNRAPDEPKTSPGNGANQQPASASDKSQPKVAPDSSAPTEPKRQDSDPDFHMLLAPLIGSGGTVHLYFLKRRPAANEEPFFVVWTDAREYVAGTGYPSDVSTRKNLKLDGYNGLLYAGKDTDRELKYTFEVTVGEKGQLKIDGKTYGFAKGALFLISGRDGEVRVNQLSRDPSKLPADRTAVAAFAKADPDVTEFIAKSAKRK